MLASLDHPVEIRRPLAVVVEEVFSVESLPCGERMVRCLLGQPVDRIPFGVGIGWLPWGATREQWIAKSGDPQLDIAQRLGFDGSFACPAVHAGIFPHFPEEILERTEGFVVRRDTHGIVRRDRADSGSMPEFLEYPVKTRSDWTRLKEERLRIDEPGRLAQDWDTFRARLHESGEAVQVGAFPYGVFGTVRDFLGVETTLMAFYDDPEMIRDMMQHLTSLWIALWDRVADEVRIDHIHIWEDMSGRQGSLISPAMVREFMMPCYDRIAEFARSRDVRLVSVDTDGDCAELVPIMMQHGINVFFPFEVQAGNDIREVRRLYPELGIWGGLDKRALAKGKTEIDSEISKAAAMIETGRYVPAFDHLIPPDVPWENFVYAADRLREMCHASRD